MRCVCGGDTEVLDTRTVDNNKQRKRKCNLCNQMFLTKEVRIKTVVHVPRAPKAKAEPKPKVRPGPKPDRRGIYTRESAAEVKQQKVDVRRKLEDMKEKRSLRVSDYYIEDEEW